MTGPKQSNGTTTALVLTAVVGVLFIWSIYNHWSDRQTILLGIIYVAQLVLLAKCEILDRLDRRGN